MAYPIDLKLVTAVSSCTLFILSESDAIFRYKVAKVYKDFQEAFVTPFKDVGKLLA